MKTKPDAQRGKHPSLDSGESLAGGEAIERDRDEVAQSDEQKARKRQEARDKIQEALRRRARRNETMSHAPRYDEVYRQGVEWLDSLAVEPDVAVMCDGDREGGE